MRTAILLIAFAIGLFWYFVPALVATSRRNPHASAIFMLNLCFGWSLIGWAVALKRSITIEKSHHGIENMQADESVRSAKNSTPDMTIHANDAVAAISKRLIAERPHRSLGSQSPIRYAMATPAIRTYE